MVYVLLVIPAFGGLCVFFVGGVWVLEGIVSVSLAESVR